MSNSEAQCGSAQDGTGVMAEQMEIHPDHNGVINTAESTPCHAWESLHMQALILIQVHICSHEKNDTKAGMLGEF